MKRDRSVVAKVVCARYYYRGKGYNSELAAYMQMAKESVWQECWKAYLIYREPFEVKSLAWSITHRVMDLEAFIKDWYAMRYPMRPDCGCSFCQSSRYRMGTDRPPFGRGCWLSKMADYRKIARAIMSDIRHGFRTKDGKKLLALPAPLQCCTGWPECDHDDTSILAGQYAGGML